jgi:hypothetical protein
LKLETSLLKPSEEIKTVNKSTHNKNDKNDKNKIQICGLHLYIPANLDSKGYVSTEEGKTSNRYHYAFATKMGYKYPNHTLRELIQLKKLANTINSDVIRASTSVNSTSLIPPSAPSVGMNTNIKIDVTIGNKKDKDKPYQAFMIRNAKIAVDCDVLLTFTWHDEMSEKIKKSGTADTWRKCGKLNPRAQRFHIPLATL